MQDEHQRSETKLTQTTNDLNEASNKTDEINRAIKTLETKNMIDEESKFNRSSRRKRGIASNPLFIIPDFFLHFPNELCYGYIRFEGNGKIPVGR